MQVFYAPDITGDVHVLDENESRHIVRVIRMRKGMNVKLIDGKGSIYDGEIEDDNPKKCIIKITRQVKNFEIRTYNLHIAISPLKNTDRFEWFVEKSVEIGIDSITPLICHNTEKQNIKHERVKGIIVSAMKQSLKSTLTTLNEPVYFGDYIRNTATGIRMIAHCSNTYERTNLKDIYAKGSDAVILIGPEGDFTAEEIKNAAESGFKSISLGPGRLRTETAGLAACHSIYFMNQ